MADQDLKLGNYLILEKIAHGGMAQIYKARTADPNGIERLVVIKRILPHISSHPEYVDMLIDEAKIAVHFTHGNIAQIYDLGKVGDDYFIVMEYVDGKTFGQIVREFNERGERIPIDLIIYCFIELCNGLDYMHRKLDSSGRPLGVIHRDISPQNIIVSYSGTVKIIDFGVAKAEDKLSHTESGVLKGKFAYMSPEQAEGESVDLRSDIFSTGTLLWEMLTQERLFKRTSNQKTVKAVRKARVDPPSKFRREVHRELDQIVLKALNKNPRRRYTHAADMAAELSRYLYIFFPNFRPMQVARFLYEFFGPEEDESGLEPELPELAVEIKPRPSEAPDVVLQVTEEKTEVEYVKNFLRRHSKKTLIIGSGAVAGLIIAASFLTYPLLRQTGVDSLRLAVRPGQAEVYINNKRLQPQTPGEGSDGASYRYEYPRGEPFDLRVQMPSYHSFRKKLTLETGRTNDLNVVLERMTPPYGDIFVQSHPTGATIFLNDSKWGQKTPAKIPRLKDKTEYRLGVSLEGYKFVERKIGIVGGRTVRLEFDLELEYGSLEIHSSPEGAHVILDEQVVGKTPYVNRRIAPGETFEFVLSLEGYKKVDEGVELKGGESRTLSFTLERL